MQHKEHHGFLYGILAAIFNTAMATFVKAASDLPVSTVVFSRFAVCVPLILPIIFHQKIHIHWRQVPRHLTRTSANLGALYCFFLSIQLLPLVNAVTLANTSPLFLPFVLLIWLRLLVSKRRFLAIAVGFVGVVILLRPSTEIVGWGSGIALAGALFGAVSTLGVRKLSKTESTETILSYYFLICAVVTFFPMWVTWKPIVNPLSWLYLLGIGVTSFFYQYMLTKAYTHAPATKTSTVSYLNVVFSGLLGWWLF